MNRIKGYTLFELSIAIAVIASISIGVATVLSESNITEQSTKAYSIASEINSGITTALKLKTTNGCLSGVSISHADLITTGVPQSTVYPVPWVTSFAFGYRGVEPVYVIVSIDTLNVELASRLYIDAKADYISGSTLSFEFPIKSPRLSSFGEMYRGSANCWAHGIGGM